MAKRKERALARKGTASKRGKGKKVNAAPKKAAKRTGAKVSAKETARRGAAPRRQKPRSWQSNRVQGKRSRKLVRDRPSRRRRRTKAPKKP
jgi:hypothetical protein